jgi:hypothetical protein
MAKFKVVVSERYFAYKHIEVEAKDEFEAKLLASEKAEEIDISLNDLEYDDCSCWIDEEIDTEEEYRQDRKRCGWKE